MVAANNPVSGGNPAIDAYAIAWGTKTSATEIEPMRSPADGLVLMKVAGPAMERLLNLKLVPLDKYQLDSLRADHDFPAGSLD